MAYADIDLSALADCLDLGKSIYTYINEKFSRLAVDPPSNSDHFTRKLHTRLRPKRDPRRFALVKTSQCCLIYPRADPHLLGGNDLKDRCGEGNDIADVAVAANDEPIEGGFDRSVAQAGALVLQRTFRGVQALASFDDRRDCD